MCGLYLDYLLLFVVLSFVRIFYGSGNELSSYWKLNLRGNCSKDNELLSYVMLK